MATGFAAGTAGAAESFGAGGGHVTSPLSTTVVPRRTSSFMSTLTTSPSMLLVLTMSSIRRKRLVAYSVDALLGETARQVLVADDGDAVPDDDLARHRELAVAALLGGHVDDDAALLHRLDHLFRDQLRRGLAGNQRGRDDDVDVLRLLREHLVLGLLEAFAHDLGVAADAAALLLVVDGHELAAQRFDLIRDFRPRVVGAHDGAEAGRGADGGETRDAGADDEDLRPAAPCPPP